MHTIKFKHEVFMKKEVILKRKTYAKLSEWKTRYAPDYALFLKGARRVGKTTLAEAFGKNEYRSFIKVNFQEASPAIKDLFVNSLMDLDYLFRILQMEYKTPLYERESLIILDEIQLFPLARQALKTLLEDKRYDYLETGSLASITKRSEEEEILIPSEECCVEMFPLDFEEFLWAMGDEFTSPIIREHYEKKKPFGERLNKDIMRKFREYMCVGGLPQAVLAYAQGKDFERADFAKKVILELYRNDIKEQNAENAIYIGNIFDSIPSELSAHDSDGFRLSHVGKNARMREYRSPLRWLEESMVINLARNCKDPSPALTLNLDRQRFKCYLLDTGLLLNLSFGDGSFLDNGFYRSILLDSLHVNEGMFVENVVAQCLRCNSHKIIFYVEGNQRKATALEIDFLIRDGGKVIPIAVKSSKSFTTRSLRKFKAKFSNRIGLQYVLYEGDVKREGEVVYLPYYMASVL